MHSSVSTTHRLHSKHGLQQQSLKDTAWDELIQHPHSASKPHALATPPTSSCCLLDYPRNRSFTLFAVPAPVPPGPTAASKLLVGPRAFLQAAPAAAVAARLGTPQGNYWVVAAGPSKNASIGYDWAIISGGARAPSEVTAAGCSPSQARDEGFWLFHRWVVVMAAASV